MSPAIRGLKELQTLQETQFDGQLDNTVRFRIHFFSADDEREVNDLMRIYQSAVRVAYNRFYDGLDQNKPEVKFPSQVQVEHILKDLFGLLTPRHIKDAVLEAKALITAQQELQQQIHLPSLKLKEADLERKLKSVKKPAKKQNYQNKLQRIRQRIIHLENLEETEQVIPAIFGQKELFHALCKAKNTDENKYLELKQEHQLLRSNQVFSRGEANRKGNQNLRIIKNLELTKREQKRYPELIEGEYYLRVAYLEYKGERRAQYVYGHLIRENLADLDWDWRDEKTAYTVRLIRKLDNKGKTIYYAHVAYKNELLEPYTFEENGCIGADLNPAFTTLAYVTTDGNLTKWETLEHPEMTYASTARREELANQIGKELVSRAKQERKGIVLEDLHFVQTSRTKQYNRMIHNFAHSKLLNAIIKHAVLEGVPIRQEKPAFTSIIGVYKYQTKYPISDHHAAAFVIGRRGLGLKEHISRSLKVLLRQYRTVGRKKYVPSKHYTNWGFWKLIKDHIPVSVIQKQYKRQETSLLGSDRTTPSHPVSNGSTSVVSYKEQARSINAISLKVGDPG